jgi:hypothetical protein
MKTDRKNAKKRWNKKVVEADRQYWCHVESVRNYVETYGHLTYDPRSEEGWDDEFEGAYQALASLLPSAPKIYVIPSEIPGSSCSFEAESAHQALVFYLNPRASVTNALMESLSFKIVYDEAVAERGISGKPSKSEYSKDSDDDLGDRINFFILKRLRRPDLKLPTQKEIASACKSSQSAVSKWFDDDDNFKGGWEEYKEM